MNKKRMVFVIVWTCLSLIGVVLECINIYINPYIGYLLLGFHIPGNTLFLFELFGGFLNHPSIALFMIFIFMAFIIAWIISLAKIKKSKMFEYLIVADRIITFAIWCMVAIILNTDFAGERMLVLLGIEIIIIVLWFAFIKKRLTIKKALD